jgi:DNA-binding NarL/FixJ family response regulator
VRLVLCDDHRLFAEPFGAALKARGHEVVLATTPSQGVRAVDEHRPDLFVVDIRFPDGDAFEAIDTVRRRHPDCPVVVLSGSDDYRDVTAATAAGVAAFLRKDQAASVIFDALERIAAGAGPLPGTPPFPSAGNGDERRAPTALAGLTERERQVLDRLLEAEDTAGIARSLGVAPSTVRTHLQSVLLKLGVHNRLEAVNLALEAGLAAGR